MRIYVQIKIHTLFLGIQTLWGPDQAQIRLAYYAPCRVASLQRSHSDRTGGKTMPLVRIFCCADDRNLGETAE